MEAGESTSEIGETPSEEGIPDYAQGYEITVCVYPDGYEVKGPSPLPQGGVAPLGSELAGESSAPNAESPERIPDLGDALKQIIAITKEHPVDGDMVSQFDAGYESEM